MLAANTRASFPHAMIFPMTVNRVSMVAGEAVAGHRAMHGATGVPPVCFHTAANVWRFRISAVPECFVPLRRLPVLHSTTADGGWFNHPVLQAGVRLRVNSHLLPIIGFVVKNPCKSK